MQLQKLIKTVKIETNDDSLQSQPHKASEIIRSCDAAFNTPLKNRFL